MTVITDKLMNLPKNINIIAITQTFAQCCTFTWIAMASVDNDQTDTWFVGFEPGFPASWARDSDGNTNREFRRQEVKKVQVLKSKIFERINACSYQFTFDLIQCHSKNRPEAIRHIFGITMIGEPPDLWGQGVSTKDTLTHPACLAGWHVANLLLLPHP